MKVNRKRFIEAMDYIKLVNSVSFTELDLSDFPANKNVPDEEREKFRFMGLMNKDFITMYLSEDLVEEQKGLEWVSIFDELPSDNTHVLTVDMNEEAAVIWHNVHEHDGKFMTSCGKRKVTHWAYMNFPESGVK